MDEFSTQVSNILSKRLKELNMSQSELATAIGVAKSSVGDWIAGISIPKADKVIPICTALNISLYEFFGINDPAGLTPEDKKILDAYKEHPEMQEAVKTLLKIN